jgi:Zn-dependent protease
MSATEESFHLGKIAGVRIGANWSLVVVVWLIAWSRASDGLPIEAPGYTRIEYWVAGVIASIAFFACLLAHELSHSVVARRHGVEVEGIVLWLFGGVSRLKGEAAEPGVELRIAIAGPMMSLLLAGGFLGLSQLVETSAGTASAGTTLFGATLGWLGWINGILAVFNLLPAFPLDGGRVLRAWLWSRHGDKTKATLTAAGAGRVFGFILIGLGLFEFASGIAVGGLWFVFLGWFLINAAGAEAAGSLLTTQLAGVLVRDVMTPHPIVAPAAMTVDELLEQFIYPNRCSTFPLADPTGTVVALLTLARVKHVSAHLRSTTRCADVATPLAEVVTCGPDDGLLGLLGRLSTSVDQRALVFDAAGLAGIVSPSDISRAMQQAELSRPS